jgi:hypothetical protein
MLRFQLHQIHISSIPRYYLPLPKMTDIQLEILSRHLEERGFSVRKGSKPGRWTALRGGQRISVDGGLGLASSGADTLDALAPAVPEILGAPKTEGGNAGRDVAERYFSLKRSGASVELQFFPRMESLRTWTCLRREGLSGLTPDEAAVLKHVLGRAGTSRVRCVTAMPRSGSRRLQVGRKLYYESALSIPEFLSSLRVIDSGRVDSASYLPRDSIFAMSKVRLDASLSADELGEWCG